MSTARRALTAAAATVAFAGADGTTVVCTGAVARTGEWVPNDVGCGAPGAMTAQVSGTLDLL